MAGSEALQQADAAVRAATRRGWAVGVGVAAGAVFLGLVLDQMPGESTSRDLARLAAQLLLPASIAFGIRAYAHALPARGVVVWLRRFHADRSKTFGALLERASLAIAYPLTLQDSKYSWSVSQVSARAGRLTPLAMVLWFVGLGVVLYVTSVLQQDTAAFVVLAIIWSAVFLNWTAGWAKRLGFRRLSGDAAARQLELILRTKGTGRRRPGLGIEVVKVEDKGWDDRVRQALDGAVLAVMDVTEVTDNLRTELAIAFGTLGAGRVILAVQEGPAADAQRIWREAVAPVRDASPVPVTPQWLASALLTYPAGRPGPVSPRFRRARAELRTMMIDRVTSTSYSRA